MLFSLETYFSAIEVACIFRSWFFKNKYSFDSEIFDLLMIKRVLLWDQFLWPAGPILSAPCIICKKQVFFRKDASVENSLFKQKHCSILTFKDRWHNLSLKGKNTCSFFPCQHHFALSENATWGNTAFAGCFLQSFSSSRAAEPPEKSIFPVVKATHINTANHKKLPAIWVKLSNSRLENICFRNHPVYFTAQINFILWRMSKLMMGVPSCQLFSLSFPGFSALDDLLLE